MLLLGGSATVNMLTGMSTEAAAFLIPIGTIAYTLIGGLKATFLASYAGYSGTTQFKDPTLCLYVALLILAFTVYTGDGVGLQRAADPSYNNFTRGGVPVYGPVKGNEQGSFLTMDSKEGLMFGIINIVGNFGTVF
eukprot:gene23538-27603_t